eukprot:CAMPEP_0171108592 /NCGR_PEP_ID=MMETSP0766_2-20121228/69227_1 /TAXON_ID=439317 /ORGANISM="Gambierdiscus australes, Strain CAWD 149" /LENGTH=150 /DNA_ID=CAMNT_0011570159 /DNA_START=50 /DNA_END=499 /DNA_ORIENTATION=-
MSGHASCLLKKVVEPCCSQAIMQLVLLCSKGAQRQQDVRSHGQEVETGWARLPAGLEDHQCLHGQEAESGLPQPPLKMEDSMGLQEVEGQSRRHNTEREEMGTLLLESSMDCLQLEIGLQAQELLRKMVSQDSLHRTASLVRESSVTVEG